MAIWESFRKGLAATRDGMAKRLAERRGERPAEALEEALLGADLGVEASMALAEAAARAPRGRASEALRKGLLDLAGEARPLSLEGAPAVVVFVGVNGSGKTTALGKLACREVRAGRRVLVAAADTFRAAAIDQVRLWAERAGADLVAQSPGADPAAVAFDGLQAARARGADLLLVDTAGRLHARVPLMEELKKVVRVLSREIGGPPSEALLVLDATTGQNALAQGRAFTEAVGVTGLVATKLDASARGGAILAARKELGVPLKLLSVGEAEDDLLPFDPGLFVDGLLEGIDLAP